MLIRGTAGFLALILSAESPALSADASPEDAGAVVQSSAPNSAPSLVLPTLPADYFATTPHLFGEWPGLRSDLANLGISASLTGVDEAVLNLSGGVRRIAQEAGQVALQTQFDLQKSLGIPGASFYVTLVGRWGRDAATDAGIPALMLINEVYGRGNIVRLEEFAYKQKLFGDRVEITAGRFAFGDEFFVFSCDFINLTFCGAPPGNLAGDYIYNWPVSQWAVAAKLNFSSEAYLKAGLYDSNPDYLDTTPNVAVLPSVPAKSRGALIPYQLGLTPKFGGLAGDYQIGGWWNSDAAPDVATSIDGEPILVSGLPGIPGHGRYGFSAVLQQQLTHDPANPDPNSGLYAFFNATYADRRTSTLDYQIAAGIIQHGVGAWRPKDEFGLAVGTTQVNPNIAGAQNWANLLGVGPGYVQHNEYALEAMYGWQTTPWLNLKLSAQYVVCPGGYSAPDNRNAFVAGVRTTVDFW